MYGNAEAGKRFREMLALGQSQPWQDTLEKLTGTRQMDASAILDYFAPLQAWLDRTEQRPELRLVSSRMTHRLYPHRTSGPPRN